jgi:UDP-N-acetylglucosamine 2-epimerase (non-hydrolysing)
VTRNQDIEIVYPVHLNPNVRDTVYKMLSGIKRINLISTIEYHELVYLLKKSFIVMTDSGGIQEEAPTFAKPVLVLRNETERPEGIEAGVAKLVGTDTERIIEEVEKLLNNRKAYNKMSRVASPYGDGYASKRIVKIILRIFKNFKN